MQHAFKANSLYQPWRNIALGLVKRHWNCQKQFFMSTRTRAREVVVYFVTFSQQLFKTINVQAYYI